MQDFKTLPDILFFQAAKFNNPFAFNFKENGQWRSFSNQEFLEKAVNFSCGLKEIGLEKAQSFAIISYQNPIWVMVDLAAILAGAVTVPIFNNIAPENLFFEISDANVKYVFTDDREIYAKIKKQNPDLKIITYGFKELDSIAFEEVIEIGKTKKHHLEFLKNNCYEQDLATIIYTSGSTGRPKGVELTNLNLVSQIKDTAQFFELTKDDVVLSFLPLAHIFERMVMMFYITQGVSIYFSDDVKNVKNILLEKHPSLMTTVPRVLEKVFAGVEEKINNSSLIKKILGKKAIKRALEKSPLASKTWIDWFFDRVIYKKIRQSLGGNLRMIICGGSALSLDLERFYRNIGINIFCGYGLTESSPVLATNCFKANKIGTIGKAFPSVKLKIADDGELLASGPNIMRGYHNDLQKTQETIVDGWLKTGDLAQIDDEGFVKIIGRKKELFKNANGKYVSPVPIEQKIVQSLRFLIGAIVIAEKRKFTSALLFPDFEILPKIKKEFSFLGSDEEFLKSEILYNYAKNKIDKINQGLDHWQQVQKFYVVKDQISVKSGEITPSMKLKRVALEEKYKNIVDGFYG